MRAIRAILLLMIFATISVAQLALAQSRNDSDNDQEAIGRTPPRLSFVAGQVSFWRPGSEEWAEAQINTALAPGDQLAVGPDGNMELQIGPRAFVRGGSEAQLSLESQEPDFLKFKVNSGAVSFDLRGVEPGRMIAVDTPQATFTMDTEGYYRLEVQDKQTHFISRRNGRASASMEGGAPVSIGPNESLVIGSGGLSQADSRNAPPLDEWDQWNYDRTDQFLASKSNRYVPGEVYGVNDLDRHGTWMVTAAYGPVWRPAGVAVGWVPYSTGVWMHDPYYGWTWVDTAPWGWAPYHYGRWVYVNSYWCWAPGPRVVRPVYAPALVAFFGQPGVSVAVSVGFSGPAVGWVALGWGEPLVPWWGRPGFIHRPWWGGWGGPHCVNRTVVSSHTVIEAGQIHSYDHMHRPHAVVTADPHYFGRGPIAKPHMVHADVRNLRPMPMAPHASWPAPGGFANKAPHAQTPFGNEFRRPGESPFGPSHQPVRPYPSINSRFGHKESVRSPLPQQPQPWPPRRPSPNEQPPAFHAPGQGERPNIKHGQVPSGGEKGNNHRPAPNSGSPPAFRPRQDARQPNSQMTAPQFPSSNPTAPTRPNWNPIDRRPKGDQSGSGHGFQPGERYQNNPPRQPSPQFPALETGGQSRVQSGHFPVRSKEPAYRPQNSPEEVAVQQPQPRSSRLPDRTQHRESSGWPGRSSGNGRHQSWQR